jgi:hypothetical protein
LNRKNYMQTAIFGFALLLASSHSLSDPSTKRLHSPSIVMSADASGGNPSSQAEPFFINAGLNDAWVNADAPFQGLFVTVFPDVNLIFVAWFTFDSEQPPEDVTAVFGAPDQRWITALGEYDGNLAELDAELTTGGKFNASDPLSTQDDEYGSISIEFTDCENGLVNYSFPPAGQAGSFSIRRSLDDNVEICEMLNLE